jgi:hypothetical protein
MKMRQRHAASIMFVGVLVVSQCHSLAQESKGQKAPKAPPVKKDSADEKTIRELIAQLGDDSFDKREAAAKRLADIGEP